MKNINKYINEKLHVTTKSHIQRYTCQPKNKDELRKIIIQRIQDEGNDCDLNDIDVSKITDMGNLLNATRYGRPIFSNVTNMASMFDGCKKFRCDLSSWNVSNAINMTRMFGGCEKFNCDISHWNISNVKYIGNMFNKCTNFNCDLSSWDISKVTDITMLFYYCKKFNQNLDKWNVSNVKDMYNTFYDYPTTPKWYDRNRWAK